MEKIIKRFFDIISSSLALLVLSPVLLAIAILIKLEDGGPVLYVQTRIGKAFVPFKLLKFRTMVVGASERGPAITVKGDPRVTRIGKVLRKYKLDELPQLINILKGEMSIVGPRPEDPRYVKMFSDDYAVILQVRPGITDYATLEYMDEECILARYDNPEHAYTEIVLPRKIELSKKYVSDYTFLEDLKIVLRTICKIISR
jgi:lipopolysaccharide/colanic/teichoic acid biosynthesis glycosyltransferase